MRRGKARKTVKIERCESASRVIKAMAKKGCGSAVSKSLLVRSQLVESISLLGFLHPLQQGQLFLTLSRSYFVDGGEAHFCIVLPTYKNRNLEEQALTRREET